MPSDSLCGNFSSKSFWRWDLFLEKGPLRILATYSGNKSYYNLIISVYGRINNDTKANADTSLLYPPLSFLRPGYYSYNDGSRSTRHSLGYYWESRTYHRSTVPYANGLAFYSTYLHPPDGNDRGNDDDGDQELREAEHRHRQNTHHREGAHAEQSAQQLPAEAEERLRDLEGQRQQENGKENEQILTLFL